MLLRSIRLVLLGKAQRERERERRGGERDTRNSNYDCM